MGAHAEPLLRLQRVGHSRQFAESRIGQFFQKAIAHLNKSQGYGAILTLALFLLGFEPRHDLAFRNLLAEVHDPVAITRTKTTGHRLKSIIKLSLRFLPGKFKELLTPVNKVVRNPLLFRHEQEVQLTHRALCLANGFPHQLDTALGFLDWPLKRVAVFVDHSQQLLAQALEASLASSANEISAGVFNEVIQARKQLFPIPHWTAVLHPLD